MAMNLDQLIEALEDLREDVGGDVEVRLAQQPSWPFEYSVDGVELVDLNEPDEDADADAEERKDPQHVVYIGEGRQLGYLPGAAANQLGWGRR